MEITGTVKKIMEAQQVSPTFRKRELVVQTDEQYPQPIMIEFTQDRADLLNRVQEGSKVTVSINIRGREWTSKEGETRYYVSIQGWRIQNADAPAPAANNGPTYGGGAPVASTPAAPNTNAFDGGDDDLPF